MRSCIPSLYYDKEDHAWRFYVNDKGDLMYNIMYVDGKWSKEIIIDNEVLDFTVNFDIDNKIYIIYSVKIGEIKYCILKENRWFSKIIYSFNNKGYEMTEINAIVIDELLHIFYIAKNNLNKIQCSLMHLCLSKNGNSVIKIVIIPFLKDTFCHYQVQNLYINNLSLIFIKHEKKGFSIYFTEYKNKKWSIPRRLYGISGNTINFCTLLHFDKINIMNLSREGSFYSLEHILIDAHGKMKSYKIHEGLDEPSNFLLVEISSVLWAIWVEDKHILASSYKNRWSKPFNCYSLTDNEILIYKYLSLSNKYNNINCKYILGTNPPKINLLLPNYDVNDYRDVITEISKEEPTLTLDSQVEENKLYIQDELLVLQKANKILENKLIDLQIKYQQHLRIHDELDTTISRLVNSRKKSKRH